MPEKVKIQFVFNQLTSKGYRKKVYHLNLPSK